MRIGDTGNLGVGDIVDWISATRVFRQSRIVIVDDTCAGIEDNIFKNRTETNGIEDLRFFLDRQSDTLN
jgi:hypothetical protein